MNFEWNQEQRAQYRNISDFARKELTYEETISSKRGHLYDLIWQKCAQIGITGMTIPEEIGGMGIDTMTAACIFEGLGYGSNDYGLLLALTSQFCSVEMPIRKFGDPSQQQIFLPDLSSGKSIATCALREPSLSIANGEIQTVAARKNDAYTISGQKIGVLNVGNSNLFLTFASVQTKATPDELGAFLIPKATPGVRVLPTKDQLGLNTIQISDLVFENCHIPHHFRIGRRMNGNRMLSSIAAWERTFFLLPFLGMLDRQIKACINYANQRIQYGKAISNYHGILAKIVEMKMRLETCRLLAYRAVSNLDSDDMTLHSSMIRLHAGQALAHALMDAIQIFGGYGYTCEYEIERHLRDAISILVLFEPDSQVQKTIARGIGLNIDELVKS